MLLTLPTPDHLQYEYTDTGAPSVDTYDTYIATHGYIFGMGSFQRLTESRPTNSRVICLNLRGYGASTPFTAEDLQLLQTDPIQFGKKRTEEYAAFLHGIITQEKLKNGSVILLNWSLGAASIVQLFRYSSSLPSEHMSTIAAAIRTIHFLDPPSGVLLGLPDTSILAWFAEPQTMPVKLAKFIASKFERPATPSTVTLEWINDFKVSEPSHAKELIANCFYEAAAYFTFMCYPPATPATRELTESILFPGPDSDMTEWSKTVPVRFLWATHSIWETCVSGKWAEESKRGRLTSVKRLEGLDHGFLWVDPQATWKAIVE